LDKIVNSSPSSPGFCLFGVPAELQQKDDNVHTTSATESATNVSYSVSAEMQQNEAILLIHFSARYSRQQIIEALDTRLPSALRAKCVPFLNGFS
jgi:ribonuclease BN (tRNA processing enzyme)